MPTPADSTPPPAPKAARHTLCSLCSQLGDYEFAFQKGGREDEATYLPAPAYSLPVVRDLKPDGGCRLLQLKQCPECETYYLYKTDYEFLVSGTEDEQELTRLTAEEAAAYLEPPSP